MVSRAKYRSERRQEQAEATRQAILDAARALFIERGYARTTVADIAAAARVAVPTVYVSVGTKPAILGELRKMIPVLAGVPEDVRARFELVSDPSQVISGLVSGREASARDLGRADVRDRVGGALRACRH